MQHRTRINKIMCKICDAVPLDITDMYFLIYTATNEEKIMVFQKYNEILRFHRDYVIQS